MMPIFSSRTEHEVFDDLESLCSSSGYIHALAYISSRDNLISYDGELTGEAMAASYTPERTIRTEFSTLLGLMLKHPVDFTLPAPSKIDELIDKTNTLLSELHGCLNAPMLESLKRAFNAQNAGLPVDHERPFRRAEELREPIFYGGESAYSFQYRDFALSRYSEDDDWLLKKKGFQISDACSVSEAIKNIQNLRIAEAMKGLLTIDPSRWTMLPGFTFSVSELAAGSDLPAGTVSAVLDALTAPPPPTNEGFTSLGEFNIANACPIIRCPSGDYVSLQSYGITEALYDTPFYWMAADKAYRDVAFTNRGTFTERVVAKRFTDVFGAGHVHKNVSISKNGNRVSEIDILITFADRAVVIQCKSKKLTLEARKGNDLQLKEDFKKAVQDAYDQALLCSKSFGDTNLKFIGEEGNEIILPTFREIYPVCVVSDHYPALTVQAAEFLTHETTDAIHPPLVTDVFFIDVLTEMLTSPLRLLSYVNRRVNIGRRVICFNEITMLGYHLKQNLWIDEKSNSMMIDDNMAIDLDTAMTVRREGVSGTHTPNGILTHLEGTLVGRMLEAIENSPQPELIDLGFMLLTLSGDTLEILNRGIEEIARQTKKDGQNHDLTLAFDEGDAGLTVHCGTLSNAEAAEKLLWHCQLRKYAGRARRWFGLAVRAEDGLPKFGVNLRSPWAQDDEMDEATKGMAHGSKRPPRDPKFRPQKIGRNEPCPCGSGKKYKKCCLA
jgi:SEC-C motif